MVQARDNVCKKPADVGVDIPFPFAQRFVIDGVRSDDAVKKPLSVRFVEEVDRVAGKERQADRGDDLRDAATGDVGRVFAGEMYQGDEAERQHEPR